MMNEELGIFGMRSTANVPKELPNRSLQVVSGALVVLERILVDRGVKDAEIFQNPHSLGAFARTEKIRNCDCRQKCDNRDKSCDFDEDNSCLTFFEC
jgi:hypothetical protein